MRFNGSFISYKTSIATETLRNRTVCVLTPKGIRNMTKYFDYQEELVLVNNVIIDDPTKDIPSDETLPIEAGMYCRYTPISIIPRGIWS